ncbi:NADH-cytochrome b5 reductase 1 [Galdieria sulphuraria]|nr:NADH-cytochrome b5 reductase 1 [Galdieria sulphuraria]
MGCTVWENCTQLGGSSSGHTQRINAVCYAHFITEDSIVCTASYDRTVRCFDLRASNRSSDPIQVLDQAADSVTDVCCFQYEILTASVDGYLRLYDIRTGYILMDYLGPPVGKCCFSHDGNCILASCLDSCLRLIDKSNGDCLAQYKGHVNEEFALHCELTLDDAFVVCGSEDGSIYYWDLTDSVIVQSFYKAHKSTVSCVATHSNFLAFLFYVLLVLISFFSTHRKGCRHSECKHIYARAWINGKEVRRPYNPINKPNQVGGCFDILVKIYPAPYGLFSRYLDSLKDGDCVEFRGPKGKFEYQRNMKKRLGMIAGGTGITPMYQLIETILNDPLERTQISLIYANHTEQDIIFRNKLESFASQFPNRLKLYFVLNQPPNSWSQGIGLINEKHIQHHIGYASPSTRILVCGPPAMTKAMMILLNKLGYKGEDIFKF